MMISFAGISARKLSKCYTPEWQRSSSSNPDKTTLLGRAHGNCTRQKGLHKFLRRLQLDYIK
jgi:hypothetical protein